MNPDEDAKNQYLLTKVGTANNGNVKPYKNQDYQNIQLSLGQYTVILKYLHSYYSFHN